MPASRNFFGLVSVSVDMRTFTLLLVGAVTLSACGGYSPGDDAVSVDVTQVWNFNEGIYAEGSYSYIRVERPGGESLLEERFDEKDTAHLRLDPGTYRFVNFQRPCDGNCDSLDPPTDECERVIKVVSPSGPGGGIFIRIDVASGARCRFTKVAQMREID